MLINDKQAEGRLNSPLNLINRLKETSSRKSAMSLFIPPSLRAEVIKPNFNPFENNSPTPQNSSLPSISSNLPETTLDNILENSDSQIRLGLAHDNALKLLNSSIELLSTKLDDISAAKLPSVISAASKTVESIRKERNESAKNNKDKEVHYHFYTPQQNKISDYEVIDVA